jgi:hypothetical protein
LREACAGTTLSSVDDGADGSEQFHGVSPDRLRPGAVYYILLCVDRALRVPSLEPVVYAGRDLDPAGTSGWWFQDVESFLSGLRFGDTPSSPEERPEFQIFESADDLGIVHTLDEAIEYLRVIARRSAEPPA